MLKYARILGLQLQMALSATQSATSRCVQGYGFGNTMPWS
jgi:hypothetical protein